MRGLDALRAAGVEWNALTTIHAANADHGREVYRFLRDECGARFVQFIPIIERVAEADADGTVPWTSWRDRPLYVQDGDRVTGRSVTAEQYGRFLIDVFEEWVRRDVGEVYVQMFDVALANWVGEPPGLCVHSETCGLALALEHTGDLYSCDHFVEPKHKLGNIRMTHMLELVDSPQQRQFGLDKRETLPQYCLDCDVRFACHGGCPKDRFIETPDGEPGPQLPLRGLQGVLPPRRRADADDGRAARAGPRAGRDHAASTPPRTHAAGATTPAPAAAAASGSTATAPSRSESPHERGHDTGRARVPPARLSAQAHVRSGGRDRRDRRGRVPARLGHPRLVRATSGTRSPRSRSRYLVAGGRAEDRADGLTAFAWYSILRYAYPTTRSGSCSLAMRSRWR